VHADALANTDGESDPDGDSNFNTDADSDGYGYIYADTYSNGNIHAYPDSDCYSGNPDSDANMHTGRDLVRHFERFWYGGG
jgi:hypothetical protein